ncbi:OmpA family protein [Nocardiopsis ganjiahuensis]|uniref:OmpA family protein n=1 Tax=Nocardiopsis ganjiahuensis TaxID=239984 RepID=UPI00034959F2|nr:OmpA family protein [Nocardiopsis ganjiahuensis]
MATRSAPVPLTAPGRLRLRAGAALTVLALTTTGCGLVGGSEPEESGEAAPEELSVDYPEGPYERRGVSGGNIRYDSTLRVDEIVGYADRTVLRLTVSPEGEEGEDVNALNAFAPGALNKHGQAPIGFSLIDPVGQRVYDPAQDDTGFVGSEISPRTVVGAHYELEAHFPPLPAGTGRVSLATPGTQGIFTGLAVDDSFDSPWDPASAPAQEAPAYTDVEPGQTVTMPVTDGPVPEEGVDLYSVVESAESVSRTSGSEHQVDLDADVLFAFDEAELTPEATATLDAVVQETREKADPELPPITVVGHTDGQGGDDHNQTLSEARADAVLRYLKAELGTDYEYAAEGRGATEPVAEEGGEDDEQARARNRRVEISYNILKVEESVETGTEEETASSLVGTGNVAAPAPYAEPAQEAVARGQAEASTNFPYDFELFSLRRDGAFVVAEFDLTNTGSNTVTQAQGAFFGENGIQGGRFGSFGIQDPGSGDVYRSLRVGQAEVDGENPLVGTRFDDTPYLEPVGYPYLIESGTTNRVQLHFPAPPLDVETVTFDAGPFGEFEGLPLR